MHTQKDDTELSRKNRALHQELFPEEYDFMMDSGVEHKLRRQGVSPMAKDYLKQVNSRRSHLGVSEILGIETSLSEESWDYCFKILKAKQ